MRWPGARLKRVKFGSGDLKLYMPEVFTDNYASPVEQESTRAQLADSYCLRQLSGTQLLKAIFDNARESC